MLWTSWYLIGCAGVANHLIRASKSGLAYAESTIIVDSLLNWHDSICRIKCLCDTFDDITFLHVSNVSDFDFAAEHFASEEAKCLNFDFSHRRGTHSSVTIWVSLFYGTFKCVHTRMEVKLTSDWSAPQCNACGCGCSCVSRCVCCFMPLCVY